MISPTWASLVACLPSQMWIQSLGWKDPLEKELVMLSSILENAKDRGAWWVTVHGVTEEPDES